MGKQWWMSQEQWEEYKMTYDYKQEVCGFDYSQFEPPEDDYEP